MQDIHDPKAIRIALCAIARAQVSIEFPQADFDGYRLARIQRDVRAARGTAAFTRGELVIARPTELPAAWSRSCGSDVVLDPSDLAWLEVA